MDSTSEPLTLQKPVVFCASVVPQGKDVDIKQSSFFQRHSVLPTPAEVKAKAYDQWLSGGGIDGAKHFDPAGHNANPPPVVFESMGLLVKWGTMVVVSEAQTIYAVRHCLKDFVPVPELYGWRTNGPEVFLYMEHMPGRTLERAWDDLPTEGRTHICRQLGTIVSNLRQLEQNQNDKFVGLGSVARGHLHDRSINPNYMSEAGPFPLSRSFTTDIKLVHGDLHPSNIIITASGPPKVVALVDWEQSGWLPAYWEDRKAHMTAEYGGEWAKVYLPSILDQYESTRDAWDWYRSSQGCFLDIIVMNQRVGLRMVYHYGAMDSSTVAHVDNVQLTL